MVINFEKKLKRKSGFVVIFGGRGALSVCVNADRTVNWHPLFFTNELHLKNYYICEKTCRGKVVFSYLGGGGVSVCVNTDRTVQLAPHLF